MRFQKASRRKIPGECETLDEGVRCLYVPDVEVSQGLNSKACSATQVVGTDSIRYRAKCFAPKIYMKSEKIESVRARVRFGLVMNVDV